MTSFKINDREWEVLFDEPDYLLKMYLGIRKHMDYKTGISGYSRRLSEHFFRELISYSSRSGRKAYIVTRSKIRNGLNVLEKLGLISPLGMFVFQCHLADWDNFVQNKYDQATTTVDPKARVQTTTLKNTHKLLNKKDSSYKYQPNPCLSSSSRDLGRYNPPPVTGYLPLSNYIDNYTLQPLHTSARGEIENTFNEFWRIYPRKDGRKKAYAIWQRKKLNNIFPSIREDLQNRTWNGDRYTPLPATYLNQERWLDETKGESKYEVSSQYSRNPQHTVYKTAVQRTAECWDYFSNEPQEPIANLPPAIEISSS